MVNNYGGSGEGMTTIASRQGGYDMYINPVTIPSSGQVGITFYSRYNVGISLNGNLLGVNPCYINNIECSLSKNGGNYYIEQINGTQDIVLERPTKVYPYTSLNCMDDIQIIWVGTNNTNYKGWDVEDIIFSQESMVRHLTTDRYIIIGLTSKSLHNDIADKNKKMLLKWGKHFLDARTYILNYGLSDAEIEPTENDTSAIANGAMPPSLLATNDEVHFNAMGYAIVAKLIYIKGQELGYW